MAIAATVTLLVIGFVGVALTLLTFSGAWLTLLTAIIFWAVRPELFSGWTLLIAALLCLAGEIAEFASGSIGAAKAGGTKRGAWGAFFGGFLGAILGTVFIPIPVAGTIAGAAIGAGLGATALERTGAEPMEWGRASRVGAGAAAGRLASLLVKVGIAAAVWVQLTLAAAIP